MQSSKAISIIKALDPEEMKRFRDFVYSPFHNTSKTLCRLFDLLKKEYPEFPEKKIEKENLYKKLFPGKAYNEQVMKNLSSGLLGLGLDFLSIDKHLEENIYDKELNLLNRLNAKRLDALYNKKFDTLETELKKSTRMIHPLFFHLHELETEKTGFLLARDKQQHAAELILKTGDFLIFYFLIELGRIAIDTHSIIHSYNIKHETNLVFEFINKLNYEALSDYLHKNDYEYSEMLNVYFFRQAAVLTNNDDDYFHFRNSLYQNLDLFSDREKMSLLRSLEDSSIHRSNLGHHEALVDHFTAIKKAFEYDLFRKLGENISLMGMRNFIHVAVRFKEFEWAKNTIEENIDLTAEESRENIYNHSYAILSYVEKDYDKALGYFNKVNLENPFYASDVKTHTAIIFYEQGYYDSALAALDTFRHMLSNRKDFSELFVEVNLHFINTLTSLIKLRMKDKTDTSAAVKLKEKLQSYGMVNHKGWLIRKIKELL